MKSLKLVAVTFALAAAITQVHADQTNFVQGIHVRLVAMTQGRTTTTRNAVTTTVATDRVDNRDIINGIGAALGNTFSTSSRLVLVSPVGGGASTFEIREANTKVDVTSFFVLEQVGSSVKEGVVNLRNGDSSQTTISIQRLALQDSPDYPALPFHFDVRGLTTSTVDSRRNGAPRVDMNADVSGTGDGNGSPTVMQGNLSTTGGTFEVVTDEIPPGV